MAHINFQTRALTLKVVYCGPGLAGKTTNLEAIHRRTPVERRGSLCSIATQGDRTLFFDHLPLDLVRPGGGSVRLQLYTVPGQPCYAATRTLVLQGVDAVVFVADSQPGRLGESVEALDELERTLRGAGKDLRHLPHVLQWNKQDMEGALAPAALAGALDRYGAPAFPASALRGEGVFSTLREVARRAVAHCDAEARGAAEPQPPSTARPARSKTAILELEVPTVSRPRADSGLTRARPAGHATALVSRVGGFKVDPVDLDGGPAAISLPRPSPVRGPVRIPLRASAELAVEDEAPVALALSSSAASSGAQVGADQPHALLVPPDGSVTSDLAPQDILAAAGSACPWSSSERGLVPDDPIIGQAVGGCGIHTKLGEGGMGAVYLARHELLGKDVVVKVLKPEYARSPRRVERFFLEARATARLEHANIVQVQDLGTNERGLHYITMQYVDGQNLEERVRDYGRHAPDEATRLVLEVARALVALHDAGMVHRDIKPENVVVTRKGEVKLIDFGLVKDLNNDMGLTRHGALVGTPVYMAPETGRVEKVDGRADIYSLGLTWFYLLTGHVPFEGQEVHEVIFGRARLRPPEEVAPELGDDLRRVLARALSWRREDRHADARQLVADLEALLIGADVPARPDAPAPPWAAPARATRRASPTRIKALAGPIPPTIEDLLRPAPPGAGPGGGPGEGTSAPLPPEAALAAQDPARRLGRLVLLAVREASGLGVLHRAWDPQRQREVLLRVVDGVRALEPEARSALETAARVRHPGIVALEEHLNEDGRLALVFLEHEGKTLESHQRPLPPAEAARVARDVALALAHAHGRGVVHGALTPGSVLVLERGRGRLLDLGLPLAEEASPARRARLHQRLERLGLRPPERVGGAAAEPTGDVWGLGAILVFALTGAPPVMGPDGLTLHPGVPPDLAAICRRALDPDLRRRYVGAGDVAADLDRSLGGSAPSSPEPPRLAQAEPLRSSRSSALALVVAGAVAVGAVLGSSWRQASAKEEQSALIQSLLRRLEEQERRTR